MRPPTFEPGPNGASAAAGRARAGLARAAGAAPLALLAVGVGALAILLTVSGAGAMRASGWGDVVGAVAAGLFTALVFAAVGAWAVLAIFAGASQPDAVEVADAGEMEAGLAAVLAGLDAARVEVRREVDARQRWMVPLGCLGGLACWLFLQFDEDPAGLFELFTFCAIGGLMGFGWAEHALSESYRRRYKAEVLPRLAARFGAMTYRPAVPPDLARLCAEGVLPAFDQATAEDEIAGRYRGLAVSILELGLVRREGKSQTVVFDGLHCAIELPRRLSGVTAVVPDAGLLGNLRVRLRREGRERVRLEDPRFEAVFEVYGSDQVAARALLTPAFMERFAALGELPGFARPLALAVDERLEIVLAKQGSANLFEPPGYREPAASRAGLAALHHDVEAVLGVADAVIGLDQAARGVAAASGVPPAQRG